MGHLLLVFAFVVALIAGAIAGRKEGVPIAGTLADILLVALLSARIGFVALYFEYYRDDLLSIIDIRDGGFSVLAGIAGALMFIAWRMRRHVRIRRPLAIAVTAGLISWGTIAGLIALMEQQTASLPQANLATLDGKPVQLSELAPGKPMVVNLWATWCPPCIREMPVLEQAQKDNPGVAFVFVNQGERPETIRRFMQDQSLGLTNLMTDFSGSLGRNTGSHGMPTTLFYNAEGRQVDAHVGELSDATLASNLEQFKAP
jgi:thiol-disulfide isomerase/thioredoxin